MWRQTLKELEDGGLKGPYSADELSSVVGPLWIAARRFGLQQGDKVRPIDNFAEFNVNKAFGAKEKVDLLSIDNVVSWARARLEAVDTNRRVYVEDSGGTAWQGWLHEDWTLDEWRDL